MCFTNYFNNDTINTMTLEQVKAGYNTLIATRQEELDRIKKLIFRVGSVRLIIVLTCLAFCYILWGNTIEVIINIVLALCVFLYFLKFHNKLFKKKRYCELQIENAANELKAIDYDFSSFDGAPEMSDANHSYSLDLDIFGNHSFFQSINRTVTIYGKKKLAQTILYPYETKDLILCRQEAIRELSQKPKLIAHFRAVGQMNNAEDLDINNFSEQFNGSKSLRHSSWKLTPYIAPSLFILIVLLCLFDLAPSTLIGVYWTFAFGISMATLKDIRKKMSSFEKKIDTLQIYSNLLEVLETEEVRSSLLKDLKQKVKGTKSASQAIKQLKSYADNLDQSSTVLGLIFLNPFLFWNVTYAIKIEKWIEQHKADVNSWFDALAEFESLISLSNFAYTHPDYTYPEVSDSLQFEARELGHPMLDRNICVRNDVSISKNPFFLVVTGANMAGKSTYLRTVGINHVLACTGAPVCASSLKFYPFRLVTNLRTSDSLADNESYFFAELKRLKMIIDRLQSGEQLFIILDEILKGTNSEDKQKGSIALMKQLVACNGNGIIATHDLLLGELEKQYPEAIKNYRFEADIKDEHLSFTYKIREGVAQNMNACFLMKKMGITGL